MTNRTRASGAVSLFVVLFASLLLTVLTVGFMRIMIQEQQQATNQDLSQSAYDSAVSGVEDAKRALHACQQGSDKACTAISAKQCTTIQDAGVVPMQSQTETVIKSGTTSDGSLNQAYTCVTIEQKTDDYIGNLTEGKSAVIPLKGVGEFDTIQVEWMHKDNGSTGTNYAGGRVDTLATPVSGDFGSLPKKSDWDQSAASLLRVESIVPSGASVSLDQLDGSDVTTTFLRPAGVTDNASDLSASAPQSVPIRVARATGNDNVTTNTTPVTCSNYRFTHGTYACRVSLQLAPSTVPADSQVAFIRLTSLYRDTSYRISLIRSSAVVQFDGVQPIVDSTGRAGNIFRRISSRVGAATDLPYPENVFDTSGSLCKNFYVTDSEANASQPCSTAP